MAVRPLGAVATVAIDEPAIDREKGTGLDPRELLFDEYDSGAVWDYDQWSPHDIDQMLERNGQAGGLQLALTLPVARAEYSFKPAKGDTGEAEWVTEVLQRPAYAGGMKIPMRLLIEQMTSSVLYRRTYFEKVWTVRDGQYVYDKVAWRPPQTCRIRLNASNTELNGFEQDRLRQSDLQGPNAHKPIWIKPLYALVHINSKRRDPVLGKSDLEVAYWCYVTQQKIRFLWYQFLESQALPRTIVYSTEQGVADEQARRVATLKGSGVLGVGKNNVEKIDTLESSGKGASEFLTAMHFLDAEMSGSVLAGFKDLTGAANSGVGSYALSKDQSDFYLMSREGAAREQADTITEQLVAPLVVLNRGFDAAIPTFEFGPLSESDVASAVALLQALATAPDTHVPFEFIEVLTIKVAQFLGLATDKIQAAMVKQAALEEKRAQSALQAKAAPLTGAVGAATRMVRDAQRRGAAPIATSA